MQSAHGRGCWALPRGGETKVRREIYAAELLREQTVHGRELEAEVNKLDITLPPEGLSSEHTRKKGKTTQRMRGRSDRRSLPLPKSGPTLKVTGGEVMSGELCQLEFELKLALFPIRHHTVQKLEKRWTVMVMAEVTQLMRYDVVNRIDRCL